jgi:hypothetical protein
VFEFWLQVVEPYVEYHWQEVDCGLELTKFSAKPSRARVPEKTLVMLHQEIDTDLELTKFLAIPAMVPEKTLSGHVAPLHSVTV